MKSTIESPITIIGAGPGGSVTALQLAKKGIPCVLIDKATFPRDKICGDAMSGKVVEVLRRLDPKLVERIGCSSIQLSSWGVTFVAPNLKELRVPFKKEYAAGVQAPGFISKRIDFDNFLINEVRKQTSIDFHEGLTIREFERTLEGYTLYSQDAKTEIRSQLVIAADGAYSAFAKQEAGLELESKENCFGIRAYYKNVSGLDQENFIELQFLKEILPGYFWIFPLPNGMANVGLGIRSDRMKQKKINLKKTLFQIVREHPEISKRFKNATLEGNVQLFPLPIAMKKHSISGSHYMLIGDAAALIDPFTGEGIGNAMISGSMAADQAEQSLRENNYDASFMKNYDSTVYKRLWSELKLSRRLQSLVNYPQLFNFVVNKAQKNKVLSETISCMFEDLDIRDKLSKPSFYFNLLMSN